MDWDYKDTGSRRQGVGISQPSEDEVPTLQEPSPPTPDKVNIEKTTSSQLIVEEREEYKILRQDYKCQLDQYDKNKSTLSSLRTSIQSFVSRFCLPFIFKTSSSREILTEPEKRLQQTGQLRESSLSAKYRKLQKSLMLRTSMTG